MKALDYMIGIQERNKEHPEKDGDPTLRYVDSLDDYAVGKKIELVAGTFKIVEVARNGTMATLNLKKVSSETSVKTQYAPPPPQLVKLK